jgi:hypothetical protein
MEASPAEWEELESNIAFASEALDVARTVWPEGHQSKSTPINEGPPWKKGVDPRDGRYHNNPI